VPRASRMARIAVVSPWPPQPSGVADYATKLVAELQRAYAVDAYHDPAHAPEPGPPGVTAIPAPLLPRLIGTREYRAILYQMGNSAYHAFLYPLMLSHPGIVTLHDLRLTNFHEIYGSRRDVEPRHLSREIAHDRPGDWIARDLPAMRAERGGVPVALAARGVDLNRRVIDRSRAVVLHSRWSCDRAMAKLPEHASKIHRIPFGAKGEVISREARQAIRSRLGLASDAVVFAVLGFLGWGKMNEEAIEAFAIVSRDEPRAVLVFAGKDLDDGRAERRAFALGLGDRVRFLEGTADADLCDLARAANIGVNLRRAPTSGETSGTLFTFLRMGVPTIVTDVDAFNDEPDDAVIRVRWQDEGVSGLVRAMRSLAEDAALRDQIGERARRLILREHCWPNVAAQYVELIEAVAASGRAAG
jgi:glycosyltransferase involved in cell wall biosynthesis